MIKTFKYRIYANKETIAKAENWLRLCCDLYNCALQERIYAYKMQRKTLSSYSQQKELLEVKATFPEYKLVGSQVLVNVMDRLDKAYQSFFKRIKKGGKVGYPRFINRNRYDSFTLYGYDSDDGQRRLICGAKLDNNHLNINNIGRFKIMLSRKIIGKIKTITIKRTSTNKWYVCFTCDNVPEQKLPQCAKTIGIDVGIKSLLTDSEGRHVENPKWLKQAQAILRRKQRKLARAKKGSNRRKETKLQLSKTYEKIVNQRNDFLHKLANYYVQNYGIIVVEDLQIKNMVKVHHLAMAIDDCGWGQFFELLSYKAEEAGRIILKERPHNTSKMCSECGSINTELKLSDREWVCKTCGAYHDRDENAAKNIKRLGQSHRTLTYNNS